MAQQQRRHRDQPADSEDDRDRRERVLVDAQRIADRLQVGDDDQHADAEAEDPWRQTLDDPRSKRRSDQAAYQQRADSAVVDRLGPEPNEEADRGAKAIGRSRRAERR